MARTETNFSGKRVVAACFIIMFVIQGGMQTFAVFMPSIVEDTGFSLVQISLISSFATLFGFLANMSFGRVLKKCGLKGTILIGIVAYSVHFYLFAIAHTLLVFYIGACMGGFVIGYSTAAACSVAITNWYVKKRATMISISFSGSMFGGAMIMYLLGILIELFGWRNTYIIQGTVLGIIAIIATVFMLIESPARKGQKPYEFEEPARDPISGATSSLTSETAGYRTAGEAVLGPITPPMEEGLLLSEARRTPAFILILLGLLLVGVTTNIENYLPAFWRSQGLSVSESSTMMAIYAGIAGLASLVLGRISDRLGAKAYVLANFAFFIAGSIAVFYVGIIGTAPMLASLVVFALGGKKNSNLMPPMVTVECFGRRDYKQIIGYFQSMLQLGIAISNPIISKLQAIHDDYQLPFYWMAALGVAALILIQAGLRLAPYHRSNR